MNMSFLLFSLSIELIWMRHSPIFSTAALALSLNASQILGSLLTGYSPSRSGVVVVAGID